VDPGTCRERIKQELRIETEATSQICEFGKDQYLLANEGINGFEN